MANKTVAVTIDRKDGTEPEVVKLEIDEATAKKLEEAADGGAAVA